MESDILKLKLFHFSLRGKAKEFVPVDFLIMDMGNKTSSPIILGRPLLRTTGAIIDSKDGNVKFQFPHKKCMEHFPRKRDIPKFKLPHELRPQYQVRSLAIWL